VDKALKKSQRTNIGPPGISAFFSSGDFLDSSTLMEMWLRMSAADLIAGSNGFPLAPQRPRAESQTSILPMFRASSSMMLDRADMTLFSSHVTTYIRLNLARIRFDRVLSASVWG